MVGSPSDLGHCAKDDSVRDSAKNSRVRRFIEMKFVEVQKYIFCCIFASSFHPETLNPKLLVIKRIIKIQ